MLRGPAQPYQSPASSLVGKGELPGYVPWSALVPQPLPLLARGHLWLSWLVYHGIV